VLLAHPAVTAAQAVGRPDVHAGEVAVAFVTLAPAPTPTPEELRAWAAERVPEQAAAPKAVTVLAAVPVTLVGKPFKPALRAEATREAVADALRDIPTVTASEQSSRTCGGRRCRPGLWRRQSLGQRVLNRFAITYRLELS
jgi:fatty-acyl-CoA synthase